MEEKKPSRTALNVAIARALHQLYDDDPKIFADPLGVRLTEEADPNLFAALRESHDTPMQRFTRGGNVMRSRFAEDELARAVSSGVQQYVLLGAGLDTFAFRQPPFARDLRIFEVDHPATQAWKRELLAGMDLLDPPNLRWAPVDFERQTLLKGLAAAGFDPTLSSYVSWLGGTGYLTRSAIDTTLRVVAALPPPSSITLSFVLPDDALSGLDLETAKAVARRVTESGEPYLSRFYPDDFRMYLRELGFSRVFHLAPAEAAMRYFRGRRDGLRAPEWMQVMSAMV
jgi:methyltransferase (TIGR00027 family)